MDWKKQFSCKKVIINYRRKRERQKKETKDKKRYKKDKLLKSVINID